MLVLTRKTGQSIKIDLTDELSWKTPVGALFVDGPIEVVVNKIGDGQVSLGIVAHPDFLILRDELDIYEKE
jgi:sRNA-binding carbon storage regulator CsrA